LTNAAGKTFVVGATGYGKKPGQVIHASNRLFNKDKREQ
jgi:hypothetical protein